MTANNSNEPKADGPAEGEIPETPDAPRARPAKEIGGRGGPDPTRFGDWEKNGRCVDF
jgi:hypothetical protein